MEIIRFIAALSLVTRSQGMVGSSRSSVPLADTDAFVLAHG